MPHDYYNEWDEYAAQWLRNLIAAGLIPPGDVDTRDIRLVQPDDLKGYTQCHFFAGIAGWPLALKLAGWPNDRQIWTGSCPCQPFSDAGFQRGVTDERHLWPELFRLIAVGLPASVCGEQVASRLGREWLSGVYTDLEVLGYQFAAVDLGAASVGAPHIRQRLWWMAYAESERFRSGHAELHGSAREAKSHDATADGGMADAASALLRPIASARNECWNGENDLLSCTDGKIRRLKSGLQPLAHGVSARVGKLRSSGNAIVPQVAAQVISAFMSYRP